MTKIREIALLGNPNSGKTTIFNALTNLRLTTANYPGVTVEKRVGKMVVMPKRESVSVLDLPGAYSLTPRSLDEKVVHDVLFGLQPGTRQPDLLILVLDANNLERNLFLAFQALETGLPIICALNMWDLAAGNGKQIDIEKLETLLGVPCVAAVGNKKKGLDSLRALIEEILNGTGNIVYNSRLGIVLPEEVEREIKPIANLLEADFGIEKRSARGEALRRLGSAGFSDFFKKDKELKRAIDTARENLQKTGIDWMSFESESRYAKIEEVCLQVVKHAASGKMSTSERIDYFLTHPVFGLVFFAGLMILIFQSIFSWAGIPMDLIGSSIDWLGRTAARVLPDGQLESLVVDGIIAGVGNVAVFLPQIFLLFFFIALMEDFGYMARAAFVLDRIMKKVGLNGKAFLPLLSSFACAIPGIMATRTIEDRNDRLATILVAPLMSCSARLPVYTLMIGAFIPAVPIFGIFDLKGMTLFSMYFLSIFAGLGMATIFRKTLLKGRKTPFVFELPPYRLPNWKTIFALMWDRGKEFIYRAGTVIFCISIILWFLISYPKNASIAGAYDVQKGRVRTEFSGENLDKQLARIDREESGAMVRQSYAGRMGRFIEPAIKPLGFDWKLGIGLISSFAAREVLVSSLAIVYNVGADADETSVDLIDVLRNEKSPVTGKPLYTPLVAVSLMVFFVLACQCMSTLAITRRETNSLRWPLFMFSYMTLLAWGGSYVTFRTGTLLGF